MSIEKFIDFVNKYDFYRPIPEKITLSQFADCLSKAHNNDYEHLDRDYNTIYAHWVRLNAEGAHGFTEEYMREKAAEKIFTFGTHQNFNGPTNWYEQYLPKDDVEAAGCD